MGWLEDSVPSIVLNYKERLFNEQSKADNGNDGDNNNNDNEGDDDEEEEKQKLRTLQAAVDKQTIAQVVYIICISFLISSVIFPGV